ncbi:acetolactate synthase, large subunit, biosynthetic type [Shouchella clausii]|uniref:Acetolactate synthase n=1 Tax=Shouchella clausii TaxID=79880 RepID=A0A268S2X0_SHOCL|nr:biosynthetic-type acetolactate synthase large subunit [Shouchella clausii]PAD41905.1 acetolactate synthase, large subunit, biosynthetic type [Bacillus sp. 7520-S]AST97089.1 acetolactate synthase, large subunit, biosynthetic type [Shouchella clausii]MBU8594627.1 biosynthetic-type acetolactate synthase large subunit [Shouchella clausii]MCY1104740.1 biosynthetic-type acetolactate synthase large subunit [Shouchella clausii]MEB5473887.1 biosynthetic-type acetolactate synthase large subunit [Shou
MIHSNEAATPQAAENKQAVCTGSEILLKALASEGVEVIFGYPGGAILPTYDEIYKLGMNHILARHEQGAIHAAEGYARITQKPGVCIVTSGPGATNVVTGIADAMMDSLPMVVITGQVATKVIGTDAFQEADMLGITMPITKHNFQIRSIDELAQTVKEAFHIAVSGRPGPVLIDLPKDISEKLGIFDYEEPVHLPGYQPTVKPNKQQIRKLLDKFKEAKRPVLLVGAGVLHAQASEELTAFARKFQIPVAQTLLGLGAFPGEEELHLGMAGMHGTYAANMALHKSDFLINIGSRFDDRLTGALEHFAPEACIAHIDIDPAEIGKNVHVEIPVVGDAKEALAMLLKGSGAIAEHDEWRKQVSDWKRDYPLWFHRDGEVIKPQELIQKLYEHTKGEAIVTTDVGQHQMWTAQHFKFNKPNRWITSGGLGTMGFGFPAAIGAQIAEPELPVLAITGDAGFQMTLQEMSILQELDLPVKIVIVNNASLGMVRQWQQRFHGERYSHSLFPIQPNFAKLAEAYNIKAVKVDKLSMLDEAIAETLAHSGPVLLEVCVAKEENVYPMVCPGTGHHCMEGVEPS